MAVRTKPDASVSGLQILANPPAIELKAVGKRFRLREGRTLAEFLPSALRGRAFRPPFWALRDLSFSVASGETLGIIGRNGSGKSTILKLIAGVMMPTEGSIDVAGRIAPLIELNGGFHPDLTGEENLYLKASILGLPNAAIRERARAIVDFAELDGFMDTPVKRFSSGMYLRLSFAVTVHSSPDILLVDEALGVGDAPFREKCLARMAELKASGTTIVFVSHMMDLVQSFCDRVLVLDGGRVVFEGGAAEAIADYGRRTESLTPPPA